MSIFELFVPPPPPSSYSYSKFHHRAQNESDFSLFSANDVKLVKDIKNLELGITSHVKMNKMLDGMGKSSVEYKSQDQNSRTSVKFMTCWLMHENWTL